jgi:hypothetical protein
MLREANLHWRYLHTEAEVVMPWYTLPCLEWLLKQPYNTWDVFEYGGGYSTIWYKTCVNSVSGVEGSELWSRLSGHILLKDNKEYIDRIKYVGRHFDCIIIDGLYRIDCFDNAKLYLKHDGVIIVDNWEDFSNEEVKEIKEKLKDFKFTEYKQPNHSKWTTVTFQKI